MQGSSHTGFALTGAMAINSAVYAISPQPLQNQWDGIVHALGAPYTYHTFVWYWQHPGQLLSASLLLVLLYKLTFYMTLIACAMWPDRWEKRRLEDGTTETRFSPHRGPTHSLVMLMLMVSAFGLVYLCVMTYIRLYHVSFSPLLFRECCVVALGVFLSFVLHILADMLTRDGVKVFWPAGVDVGIPPIPQARPLYGSGGEYAWLWAIIFMTGILFTLGIVGV